MAVDAALNGRWGVHLIANTSPRRIFTIMNQSESFENQSSANSSSATATGDPNEIDSSPSADEVAKENFFSEVNLGWKPGQRWLDAEAQVLSSSRKASPVSV